MGRDTAQMGGRRLSQPAQARVGQGRPLAATVVVAQHALDEAIGDEAINESGDPGPGQEQAIGELAHSQPPLVRSGQLDEHVVVGERHALLVLELAFEAADDLGVRAEEGTPGADARIIATQIRAHRPHGCTIKRLSHPNRGAD